MIYDGIYIFFWKLLRFRSKYNVWFMYDKKSLGFGFKIYFMEIG